MCIDFNELICSLLQGAIPILIVGSFVWNYQHKIEKKDRINQMFIERRKILEDELYECVKKFRHDFSTWRLSLLNNNYNEDEGKKIVTYVQKASDLIKRECVVLDKYSKPINEVIGLYNKFVDECSQCNDKDIVQKVNEYDKIFDEKLKSISILYYNIDPSDLGKKTKPKSRKMVSSYVNREQNN